MRALINYYCREKYFNHVLNAAAVAQRKFSNYPTFRFVHAYNRDVIQELDANVKEDCESATPKGLYYAGMFLWLLGRNDKAREYIERAYPKRLDRSDLWHITMSIYRIFPELWRQSTK
ncbi:unnamed protein product [Coregonus sp. 'balchen']|nr:unnamed protein product [Coregonus sp. 'balchen']